MNLGNKIIIVGAVAGGATAAARARRLNENAEIILLERGEFISFANCGLPYYIGGAIKDRDDLLVTTAEDFESRYNIDIRPLHEVLSIDRAEKRVQVKNIRTGKIYHESYDKMILSPGADPIKPDIEGITDKHIFTIRNIPDTDRIIEFVDVKKPQTAVIVGGGFIGLEMAENLTHRGVKTTLVEIIDQVLPPLDFEMSAILHDHLWENGVILELENGVTRFTRHNEKIIISTTKGYDFNSDMVIWSAGVKPENLLATGSDLNTGLRGGIQVDESMMTSDPDIYATGDAVITKDFITGADTFIPLAGPANKQGRIAADNTMGRKSLYPGSLGTSIVKVFGKTAAITGLSEKRLKEHRIPYLKSYTLSASHATYYPGAEILTIKLLFTPGQGKILGAQIVGGDGVDKRIDVVATAIHGGMTVHDLERLDLAYAPPYSSAKDPVNIAGFVASNIIKGDLRVVHWHDIDMLKNTQHVLIDLRTQEEIDMEGTIEGSIHIPVDELRERLHELDRSKSYILLCAIGLRGYIGYRILCQKGFNVKSLSGGFEIYKFTLPI